MAAAPGSDIAAFPMTSPLVVSYCKSGEEQEKAIACHNGQAGKPTPHHGGTGVFRWSLHPQPLQRFPFEWKKNRSSVCRRKRESPENTKGHALSKHALMWAFPSKLEASPCGSS